MRVRVNAGGDLFQRQPIAHRQCGRAHQIDGSFGQNMDTKDAVIVAAIDDAQPPQRLARTLGAPGEDVWEMLCACLLRMGPSMATASISPDWAVCTGGAGSSLTAWTEKSRESVAVICAKAPRLARLYATSFFTV
nr:hypothetical protein [uncultured Thioclava sp.]